jgi:hypothetical protein
VEPLSVLEARLQDWSVPSDVRDAVHRAVDVVAGEGAALVDQELDDQICLAVRGHPAAVYISRSRVSAALDPLDAERAHRADSAIGLDKDDATTWIVHCRYGRLDSSRLGTMTALMIKALRRFAPRPEPRQPSRQRRRAAGAARSSGASTSTSRSTSTAPPRPPTRQSQEERRRAADAAIPRCPVPGCNLPMVGGSCGFHD